MTSKIFIDTNILVYTMDKHDTAKQQKCRGLLKSLAQDNLGVISTQVLQEFYVVATKKLKVDPLAAKDILASFEYFEIIAVTPQFIKDAIDISIINMISFWDALIVASAEHAKCSVILTEDLNHGQIIRGVKINNPFNLH
ncbi:MAG: PIN domain nuclease [Deltaproteobacteria bacterium]|nr:MAG: PIN domain nuclease [Deltaproteobacteria bacterium]